MKVILVYKPNEPIVNTQQNIIPNGLLYIGAYLLSKGIDAEIINLYKEPIETILNKRPDVIGISCFTFNRHACINLAKEIRSKDDRVKIVLGGPHASIMYEQLINLQEIDMIIQNEGEMTFYEVIEALMHGLPIDKIKGLVYKKDGKVINNGQREPIDLDELPIPARYFRYKRLITSRGCPGNCIFCDTPCLWGRKLRLRSAKSVVDEIELLANKYGQNSFIMSDDTFTFDKNRTIEICREIIARGLKISWDCRSRVNFICEERILWMKKAGCTIISYGIESGSPQILRALQKGFDIGQVKEAARLTRKYGLGLNFYIIVGSPGETDDTIRETMALIEETKPTSIFTFIMQLTPGTQLYDRAKAEGFISDDYWLKQEDDAVFYTREMPMERLVRYAGMIGELFRIYKDRFAYKDIKSMEDMSFNDYLNMAQLEFAHKNLDACDFQVRKALELNPQASSVLMIDATLHAIRKDPACIEIFERSIRSDFENVLSYKNLALFYQKELKDEEAKRIVEKAIEIEPADAGLHKILALSLIRLKKLDEARDVLKACLSIDPADKEAAAALKDNQVTTPSSL